ncbi:protein pufQ [Fertoebacter nigrum]|uniref:Protein pufQ n=1 Tax=Fertoeibacter niger TaxID=2656921 RepID=A0A8X8GX75_9RHOB|nr:cytochrome PufQ [Fertoeibacter niger]NUB43498.1 protein pufQ [Fertoeibacter niger]
MSDQTANTPVPAGHAHRAPRAEFYAYFAVILAFAVPFALLGWVVQALRHGRLPKQGPLAAAWADAGAITPLIFRA